MSDPIDLRDDAGTTLLEVVVAMALLTAFMGIFTVSTVMMTRTTSTVQAAGASNEQVNTAFLTLERQLRYATGISDPESATSGVWNVEFSSGTNECTQLRITTTGQLQQRSWRATTPVSQLSSWKPLASGVTNGATGTSVVPFVKPTPSANVMTQYQQLTVTLETTAGAGQTARSSRSTVTYSAQNSPAPGTAAAARATCPQIGPNA